jgi:hypothetical protein
MESGRTTFRGSITRSICHAGGGGGGDDVTASVVTDLSPLMKWSLADRRRRHRGADSVGDGRAASSSRRRHGRWVVVAELIASVATILSVLPVLGLLLVVLLMIALFATRRPAAGRGRKVVAARRGGDRGLSNQGEWATTEIALCPVWSPLCPPPSPR